MVRCNRVKSELIVRRGLTEDHFTTTNNVGKFQGMANVVIVTLPVMKAAEVAQAMEQATEPEQPAVTEPEPEEIAVETPPQEPQDTDEVATPAETVTETQEPAPIYNKVKERDFGSLALRANLLRWATLTPDLGLEWRVSRTWAVLVHGSWTSWSWDDKNRRYALWEVAPEVRWYLGEREGTMPSRSISVWALAISAPTTTSMWSSTTCASAPARAARTGGAPSMRVSPWYGHYSDRKEEKK